MEQGSLFEYGQGWGRRSFTHRAVVLQGWCLNQRQQCRSVMWSRCSIGLTLHSISYGLQATGSERDLWIRQREQPLCQECVLQLICCRRTQTDRPGHGCEEKLEETTRDHWGLLWREIPPHLLSITEGQTLLFLLAPKSGMHPAKVLSPFSNQNQFGLWT